MTFAHRLCVLAIATAVTCGASSATAYRIDGTLPSGGDCPVFGLWDAAAKTCRIETSKVEAQDSLTIASATVEVAGTLTNEGLLDNRGTLVVDGFLDSTNDLVNFWDGTMIVRGQFFSHFMYNFGRLTNGPEGTIEFEFHLENNAPMTNYGHIDVGGTFINIPARRLDNFGSLAIAPTGSVSNAGTLVNTGRIDNSGSLLNDAEFVEHCESVFTGNPVQGLPSTGAQSLTVESTLLQWCPIQGAHGYDVVEGDLGLLRASDGDFTLATTHCLGNDMEGLSLAHVAQPAAGRSLWFLVRANGVGSADFDTVFPSQIGSRVLEIAGSASACP